MRNTIRLASDVQRQDALRMVLNATEGYFVTVAEPTRTLDQNALMWPLLADLQAQLMPEYSTDDIKLRFLHALGSEMRFLPELEGEGQFPVGQRSSMLTKKQFAGLIELIYAYGSKHEVLWSYNSQDTFRKEGIT